MNRLCVPANRTVRRISKDVSAMCRKDSEGGKATGMGKRGRDMVITEDSSLADGTRVRRRNELVGVYDVIAAFRARVEGECLTSVNSL